MEKAATRPTNASSAGGTRDPSTLRRLLIEDGRAPNAASKIHCLSQFHADNTPSAHVFDDPNGGHVHCFACTHHVDAYQYLVEHRGLSKREAFRALEPGGIIPATRRPKVRRPTEPRVRTCPVEPLPQSVVAAHRGRAAHLERIPAAAQGRGFALTDLRRLVVAARRDRAVFPITSPDGQVLRLKMRRAPDEPGDWRYHYVDTAGQGTPAWCSPGFGKADQVLIVEGELNGMACWLARPELDVVGVAGTSGSLPFSGLKGRCVVVYADGDEPGKQALGRWTKALAVKGCSVNVLPAWSDGDACDIAGRLGRDELRRRLS